MNSGEIERLAKSKDYILDIPDDFIASVEVFPADLATWKFPTIKIGLVASKLPTLVPIYIGEGRIYMRGEHLQLVEMIMNSQSAEDARRRIARMPRQSTDSK